MNRKNQTQGWGWRSGGKVKKKSGEGLRGVAGDVGDGGRRSEWKHGSERKPSEVEGGSGPDNPPTSKSKIRCVRGHSPLRTADPGRTQRPDPQHDHRRRRDDVDLLPTEDHPALWAVCHHDGRSGAPDPSLTGPCPARLGGGRQGDTPVFSLLQVPVRPREPSTSRPPIPTRDHLPQSRILDMVPLGPHRPDPRRRTRPEEGWFDRSGIPTPSSL